MRLVPFPCGLDDRVDTVVLRRPIQKLLRQAIVSDQFGRIASAAIAHDGWNRMPSNFPTRFDNFMNACPASCTQVGTDSLAGLD